MNKKVCCVVPNDMRKDSRIMAAARELGSFAFSCSFERYLSADYEHKNENFCILHLPFEVKEQQKLLYKCNEAFQELLKNGVYNYKFINASNLEILDIKPDELIYFVGSYLYSINIKQSISSENKKNLESTDHPPKIDMLSFISTILLGENIIEGQFKQIHIKDSDISSHLSIENSKVDLCIIRGSNIHSGINILRAGNSDCGICLTGSKFNQFSFINNKCDANLKFDNSEIESLYIKDSIFSLCPSFFNTDFTSKNKKIVFPNKKSFNRKKLIDQALLHKRKKCFFFDMIRKIIPNIFIILTYKAINRIRPKKQTFQTVRVLLFLH